MELTKSAINSRARAEATDIYKAMCLDAAENVDANFVSIWRFDETKSKVVCLFAVDIESGETSSGQELLRKDFPRYFGTILEETVICAPDACAHHQTSELAEAYFKPNGIVSLLDFIVHKHFLPIGIICCESKWVRKDWTASDITYLRDLATLASFKANV